MFSFCENAELLTDHRKMAGGEEIQNKFEKGEAETHFTGEIESTVGESGEVIVAHVTL